MNNDIKIGQLYRHKKGNLYEVIALGTHSETEEEMVGYRGVNDGKTWFRPRAMFAEADRFMRVKGSRKNLVAEILGWYGVAALLGAFVLVSFGAISAQDALFQILNVTGAVGIVVDALAQKNWQPAVLNIVWGLIGLFALIKILI